MISSNLSYVENLNLIENLRHFPESLKQDLIWCYNNTYCKNVDYIYLINHINEDYYIVRFDQNNNIAYKISILEFLGLSEVVFRLNYSDPLIKPFTRELVLWIYSSFIDYNIFIEKCIDSIETIRYSILTKIFRRPAYTGNFKFKMNSSKSPFSYNTIQFLIDQIFDTDIAEKMYPKYAIKQYENIIKFCGHDVKTIIKYTFKILKVDDEGYFVISNSKDQDMFFSVLNNLKMISNLNLEFDI